MKDFVITKVLKLYKNCKELILNKCTADGSKGGGGAHSIETLIFNHSSFRGGNLSRMWELFC